MNSRTWNLKLNATDTHPEATVNGLSQEDAARVLRGLIHGPASPDYAYVESVVATTSVDRHEGPLAA